MGAIRRLCKNIMLTHMVSYYVWFFFPAGRRRHTYRRVFQIIVSTYMIMSAILIPMGFMFMSTLGGEALLVSKMALMVSLMSNIKKIFSYEYYVPPAPAAGHHHGTTGSGRCWRTAPPSVRCTRRTPRTEISQ